MEDGKRGLGISCWTTTQSLLGKTLKHLGLEFTRLDWPSGIRDDGRSNLHEYSRLSYLGDSAF